MAAWRVVALAATAMVAFASNSVLNRFALDEGSIDAATFSTIRISSGALLLVLLVAVRKGPAVRLHSRRAWISAAMLFGYASAFSFAYLRIGAGAGALLLFGVVQIVMYSHAIARGERPGWAGWVGLAMAAAGIVALVAPGATAPDPVGAALMVVAGLAWAGYTLRGRGASDPIGTTAANFVLAVPFALALQAIVAIGSRSTVQVEPAGVAAAVMSGAVASALGYTVWYAVLPRLTGIQAGIIQLAPAPLAVFGGVLLLGEALTLRVVAASVLVLSGVAAGVVASQRSKPRGRAAEAAGGA